MNKQLIEALENQGTNCRLISFTYTAKGTGETARYVIRTNVDYTKVCKDDITELEIRAQTAIGIEKICIDAQIATLKESIKAQETGVAHSKYTKAGLYRSVCPGIKLSLNDQSLELHGFVHSKVVLKPGFYAKVNHRSEETAKKEEIRKSLKVGKFRSFSLDSGLVHGAKVNGEEITFEQ